MKVSCLFIVVTNAVGICSQLDQSVGFELMDDCQMIVPEIIYQKATQAVCSTAKSFMINPYLITYTVYLASFIY